MVSLTVKIFLNKDGNFKEGIKYHLSKKSHLESLDFVDELKKKIKTHFDYNLKEIDVSGKGNDDVGGYGEGDAYNGLFSYEKTQKTKIRRFLVR